MSKSIHTPALANVVDHSPTSSTFTVEPLYTGYGMTLGNSLRRVLLSSIAGAAVTAFRIDGTSHEFTTVKGVKEDVVDIMLNLKGLRFRVFSDEPQLLKLNKKGKGVVTAKDFQLNADTEVVNPGHTIATVDNDKAGLNLEVQVEVGRGYQPLEEQAQVKKISDMVLLDAIFSPVLRVRYKVENTRVGQITNLDRLLITVDTDGSITPREAFEEAAAILINQYSALAGQTRLEPGLPLTADGQLLGEEADADEPAELMTSIEDLNLSARTTNALVNNDIHTIKDLLGLSEAELRDLKGFGNKALDEVKDKISELEL
ncbi:DNA-directed RNA polymerase subunit alpha [Candidatus Saccharibacteria bacterium RIFCSPLOWO2_01_FULL_48_13]|nr:MAG: DNA-directed RNA polymerase subunit alpha [Candidatus Saccharibacteria bacterium RIFCSPHIGHO2_01_FULL_48_12]OGL35318.1 MAG: DNA-directed RNA polymerase subunit alpha [Candidatus Saccharibacteria bacterium RIFCSPHIGHO2_12_FULL_48_21]OGL37553.1 MAG: DNA-directed RNA polymerase subunit alpha [Candidatus Saccharibacteria bacterium RIFCSPLOWO2_01_FULL_48_13]